MSDHIKQRLSFMLTQYHIISPLNISKHESTKEEVGVRSSTSHECIAPAICRPTKPTRVHDAASPFVGQILKVLETENEKCVIYLILNEYYIQKRNAFG